MTVLARIPDALQMVSKSHDFQPSDLLRNSGEMPTERIALQMRANTMDLVSKCWKVILSIAQKTNRDSF